MTSNRLMKPTNPVMAALTRLAAAVGLLALSACAAPGGDPASSATIPGAPPRTDVDSGHDVLSNPAWQPVPIDQRVRSACWSPAAGLAAVLSTDGDDVVLTGVDLGDARVAWTAVVATITTDSDGYSNSDVTCDKAGRAVVVMSPPYGGGDPVTTVATVSLADGSVLGKRDVPNLSQYFLVGDRVVVQTGDQVEAYPLSDLAARAWGTAARLSGVIGDDFVVLESSIVRADTGAPAGFGGDVGANGVSYQGSGAGRVIRTEPLGDANTGQGECQVRYQAWDTAADAPIWTVTGMQGVFSYADQVFYLLSDVKGSGMGCACQFATGKPTMTAYSMADGKALWSVKLPEFSGTTGIDLINDTDPVTGSLRPVTTVAYETQVAGSGREVVVLVNVPDRTSQTVDGYLTGYGTRVAYFTTGTPGGNQSQAGYDTLSTGAGPLWTIANPAMPGDSAGVSARQVGPWLVVYPVATSQDARGMSVLHQQ